MPFLQLENGYALEGRGSKGWLGLLEFRYYVECPSFTEFISALKNETGQKLVGIP
jgi:hypothetical protein